MSICIYIYLSLCVYVCIFIHCLHINTVSIYQTIYIKCIICMNMISTDLMEICSLVATYSLVKHSPIFTRFTRQPIVPAWGPKIFHVSFKFAFNEPQWTIKTIINHNSVKVLQTCSMFHWILYDKPTHVLNLKISVDLPGFCLPKH